MQNLYQGFMWSIHELSGRFDVLTKQLFV